MNVPVMAVVYRVALSVERAAKLRTRAGTDQAAAEIEVESCFPPPADAKVVRVEPDEPDEPVAIFVDAGWPHCDP